MKIRKDLVIYEKDIGDCLQSGDFICIFGHPTDISPEEHDEDAKVTSEGVYHIYTVPNKEEEPKIDYKSIPASYLDQCIKFSEAGKKAGEYVAENFTK